MSTGNANLNNTRKVIPIISYENKCIMSRYINIKSYWKSSELKKMWMRTDYKMKVETVKKFKTGKLAKPENCEWKYKKNF